MLHARWLVQDEVCKRYMEHFEMVGYEPDKMSDTIKDHPEWEDNPKLHYFFVIEHWIDRKGKPCIYFRDGKPFNKGFFNSTIDLLRKGLVKIGRTYQRDKAVCCGYADTKHEDPVGKPQQLKDIQMIGVTEKVY